MPYMMEIAFDNDHRLKRKYYLFEYKSIRFKLIQDLPNKWSDHLLTILPNDSGEEKEKAFSVASEFISALGWKNKASMAVREIGGGSWHADQPLSRAKPSIWSSPKIAHGYGGLFINCNLDIIPMLETEQQRIALTLYREANASNNDYLSFLFYWQILETGGTVAEGYVNKIQRKNPRHYKWVAKDIIKLELTGRRLGEYLRDECRDAIAHIRRKPGKRKLEMDKTKERHRIYTSTRIIKNIAEYYIENHLNLNKQMYLKRKGRNGFPVYVDSCSDEYIGSTWRFPAYK